MKKILIAAAECVPFAKTGGLADVAGALATHLPALGYDTRVIMPLHRIIRQRFGEKLEHLFSFSVQLGWRTQYVGIERICMDGATYYFVDNEFYFGDMIYRGGEGEGEQYSFFCRAVLEALPMLDFIPDILHCNDWHTAMLPMLLKTQYADSPIGGVKTLLTIHNIAYQGKFSFDFVHDLLGIDAKYYTPEFLESYGCANYLKAGCVFADRINTVSPSYAQEIRGAEYSEGLDGILNARAAQLSGILNGIDTHVFDPETDKTLPKNFTKDDLSGKSECKRALMGELGLQYDPDRPVIASISRLAEQKGIDLVSQALPGMVDLGANVIILGSGQREYEDAMRYAESRYRGRVCAYIGYNEELAHRIYAGSDFLVMASRFEPCGLSQMIAMRYGTLPIVRETGGLRDSVIPYNRYTGEGNGFSFARYDAQDLYFAVERAVHVYRDKAAMAQLIDAAMSADFSFPRCAEAYAQLYMQILG